MVISQIVGGLGNQMFEYAIGRRMALDLATELRLDLSGFANDPKRVYALGKLQVDTPAVPAKDLWRIKRASVRNLLQKIFLSRQAIRPIREAHFHFDPTVLSEKGDIYLKGYWQSEKYFLSIAEVLRREFQPRNALSGLNLELAKKMDHPRAVSVHIRRGDYIMDPHTNQFHGSLDLDYYRHALEHIRGKITNPELFIFSDDPDWVRSHFHLGDVPMNFISHNTKNEEEDLRLMSLCAHHIVANSSFSWWGAWLNPRPQKIVVAPAAWFRSSTRDTKDLVPETWIRV